MIYFAQFRVIFLIWNLFYLKAYPYTSFVFFSINRRHFLFPFCFLCLLSMIEVKYERKFSSNVWFSLKSEIVVWKLKISIRMSEHLYARANRNDFVILSKSSEIEWVNILNLFSVNDKDSRFLSAVPRLTRTK